MLEYSTKRFIFVTEKLNKWLNICCKDTEKGRKTKTFNNKFI